METLLIVLAFICAVVGVVGSVVPGLPGPPVSWIGLLLFSLTATGGEINSTTLIVTAIAAAVITLLDYLFPSKLTKTFGGSKYGVWGCNIGLVVSLIGLPFGPHGLAGIIFWPFVGAFVGELLNHKPAREALKAAFGAFTGFLTGTLIKLVYCVVLLVVMIVDLF